MGAGTPTEQLKVSRTRRYSPPPPLVTKPIHNPARLLLQNSGRVGIYVLYPVFSLPLDLLACPGAAALLNLWGWIILLQVSRPTDG